MSTNRKNVIANRYEVIQHIGQGGMADVFLAVDTILNRQVAIKILRSELGEDAVNILRFEREAQAATALAHPNIVEIYDVGEYKNHHYIVMEYLSGRTLKQVIRTRGPLVKEEAIDIMKQLCSATSEAHKRGIIHRDLKPQNVIVKADGSVKILDFGIAIAKGLMQLTQANNVMGSVHYLAPELAKGDPATPQSDIYALGIILFEMLTGKVPYVADQPVQIALMHMRDNFPSVREINPDVPQSIENIVYKATAKNPAERYETCDAMLEDLRTCLQPERLNEEKIELSDYRPTTKKSETTINATPKKKKPVDPEVEAKRRRKRTFNKVVVPILSVLTGVFILFMLVYGGVLGNRHRMVEVPDLEGMTLEKAMDFCEEENLVLDASKIKYALTENTEKGIVIAVDPEIGSSVERGSKISVTVSNGIGVTIGDYVGQNVNEVLNEINKKDGHQNLKVNVKEEESDQPSGTIIRQEQLEPGDQFESGSVAQVTFVYSSYLTITIPDDIVGKDVQAATQQLQELGVEVRTSNRDTTSFSQEEMDRLEAEGKIGVVDAIDPGEGSEYTQRDDNFVTLYYY